MAIKIDIDVKGTKAIQNAIKRAGALSPKALGAGLYSAGNDIMRLSKRKVPVDTGTLRGSGYVTMPDIEQREVSVELGYGGPAAAYAVVQHERTELKHPEGGEAKYLENAYKAKARSLPRRIATISRRAFEEQRGARREPDMPVDPHETAVAGVAAFLRSFGGS